MILTRCEHCGYQIEADASLAGGIINCPQCSTATKVEGLRDPLWRLIQIGGLVVCVGAVFLTAPQFGPVIAVAIGAGLAACLWLVSRGL